MAVSSVALEILADAEHDSWARWQGYLFSRSTHNADGSVTIPADLVERWQRQVSTDYADLSDIEQESDRKEVRAALAMLNQAGFEVVPAVVVPLDAPAPEMVPRDGRPEYTG